MLIFKEQIHYLGHLVSRASILPLTDKLEVLIKLKPLANIEEVRHFLGLTCYYRKFICNYLDNAHPLNCLTHKSQPFIWTPDCQSSFGMLCSWLSNMPIAQLPDPNKPNLLFIDVSKFCYSGVLTQDSTAESNEFLIKLLTDKEPLKSAESQIQDLQLEFNIIHLVVYISGSFPESQYRWPGITKECFGILCQAKSVLFTYKMQIY